MTPCVNTPSLIPASKPVYTALTQHQLTEDRWELHDTLSWLQTWKERFIFEFKLQVSEIALCVDCLHWRRLGHFRRGHYGFGLAGEIAINRLYLPRPPIVTVSFGEERVFRLRPWKGNGFRDFLATHGAVFIMPYNTNLAWTHEVPHRNSHTGRRISITARAFSEYRECSSQKQSSPNTKGLFDMATHNPRYGYHWTQEEKDERKPMLRKVNSLLNRTRQQVGRIKTHLPEFAERAEASVQHLLEGLGAVTQLDLRNQGRKYQPMLPEEMDVIVSTLPELLRPWQDLTSSPEYVAAVRSVNKKIRAVNKKTREHNRMVVEQHRMMVKKLREAFGSPV